MSTEDENHTEQHLRAAHSEDDEPTLEQLLKYAPRCEACGGVHIGGMQYPDCVNALNTWLRPTNEGRKGGTIRPLKQAD